MAQDNPNDTIPVEESQSPTPTGFPTPAAECTVAVEATAPEEGNVRSSAINGADTKTSNDGDRFGDETESDELEGQATASEQVPNASDAITPLANVPPATTSDDADGRCDIERQPYDFDRCTVQIAIQLLPADGDAHGRRVILGVRSHLDAPIWRFVRWSELGTLPPLVSILLDELRSELPAREQAARAALEKAKQEKEERRANAAKVQAQRRAERGRSKTATQKNGKAANAAPTPSDNSAVPAALPTPRAPLPTATAMEQTKQMGLF